MKSSIIIWHNNRCGKSREAVKYLEDKGLNFEQRLYMTELPTKAELKDVLKKLGIPASEWVRKKEAIYKELFAGKTPTEDEIIDAMIAHPQLIERPVIVKDNKAIIARPASEMDKILG